MTNVILAATGIEAAYWWIAVVSTVLFMGKLLLTLLAGGLDADFDADALDLDFDADVDTDLSHGSDAAFNFISIQSLLAFLMGFGWMALTALRHWELGRPLSFAAGFVFGLMLMLLSAYLMFLTRKLNAAGDARLDSCIGKIGRVYLKIPSMGSGAGQVEVVVSGRKRVVRALSNGPEIESFSAVRVVDVKDNREIIVTPEL